MTVTFLGHCDAPFDIFPKLTETLTLLIENESADTFFIGDSGAFDHMAYIALKMLSEKHPDIKYSVVLSATAEKTSDEEKECYADTIIFDTTESTEQKHTAAKLNEFMINKADTVVSYVTHTTGAAYRFSELAKKKGKKVINIA